MFSKIAICAIFVALSSNFVDANPRTNAELLRRGLPINRPASFKKRSINGLERSLPATRVRSARLSKRSAAPLVYARSLVYNNPAPNDATQYYLTPDDGGAFGGLALSTNQANEIDFKWYDTGLVSPLTGLKYFQAITNDDKHLCMARNGVAGVDDGSIVSDGNVFAGFCKPQTLPGEPANCYNVYDSAQHNWFMDWGWTIDPVTLRVGFEWLQKDGQTLAGPVVRAQNGYSYWSIDLLGKQETFNSFLGLQNPN